MSITIEPTASLGLDLESSSDTVTLRSVFLHVTKACNLRCSYCYFSASQPLPNEMTTADFVRLWPELVALRPQKVVFTGGEPLLRPDILDLLRSLRDADPAHHILRCLNSNGHLVTLDLAEKLVGLVDEVRVSLDGMRDHNDLLRGTGNFDAAVRALEYYYTVGFESKVLVTVSCPGGVTATDASGATRGSIYATPGECTASVGWPSDFTPDGPIEITFDQQIAPGESSSNAAITFCAHRPRRQPRCLC